MVFHTHFGIRFKAALLIASLLMFTSINSLLTTVWASTILQGHVQEEAYQPETTYFRGKVIDAQSGQPLANAVLQIPDLDQQVLTNARGEFQIEISQQGPLIINVLQRGYLPQSLTLQAGSTTPALVKLRPQRQVLILDNELHHLGDNQFSVVSAGVGAFQKSAEGQVLVLPFVLNTRGQGLNPNTARRQPVLEIGAIVGLDTEKAHQLNQSGSPHTSSPMQVRLNGIPVATLASNGIQRRITLPTGILNLNGENVLEIQTGAHRPNGKRLDYDDMELMTILLEL